jgi:hypothetical protein
MQYLFLALDSSCFISKLGQNATSRAVSQILCESVTFYLMIVVFLLVIMNAWEVDNPSCSSFQARYCLFLACKANILESNLVFWALMLSLLYHIDHLSYRTLLLSCKSILLCLPTLLVLWFHKIHLQIQLLACYTNSFSRTPLLAKTNFKTRILML